MSLDVLLGQSVTSWQLTNKELALLSLSLLARHLLTLQHIYNLRQAQQKVKESLGWFQTT